MTESMKFGPEWLRNKSHDISPVTYNSATLLANNSSIIIKSANRNDVDYDNPVLRSSFPEFRYGREEMLSLFEKNCRLPEILPLYKNLYVEKIQCPLALTPGIDEVIMQVSTLSIQRPLWLQRPPVGFSGSVKNLPRGGVPDKGRLRSKSVYNSGLQRFNLCDDDIKSTKERIWFEHNGKDITAANSGGFGVTSEWVCTPNCSPKKDFVYQSKYDNWRRNRNIDDTDDTYSNVPSEDWRMNVSNNLGNSHRFSYIKGRSFQWRHENISLANNNFTYTDSVLIKRSCSSACQLIEKGSSQKECCKENYSYHSKNSEENKTDGSHDSQISDHMQKSKNDLQLQMDNNCGSECDEQNLPEWAIENPSEIGGTFDSNGAFHGMEAQHDGSLKITRSRVFDVTKTEEMETHKIDNIINSENISDSMAYMCDGKLTNNNLNFKELQRNGLCSNCKDENEEREKLKVSGKLSSTSFENIRKMNYETKLEDEKKACIHSTLSNDQKESYTICNSSEKSYDIFTTCSLNEEENEKSNLECFDPLKKVADDMIKKLIMDDDQISNTNQVCLPLSEVCSMVQNSNCMSRSAATSSKTPALNAGILNNQLRFHQNQTQHQIHSLLPIQFLPHKIIYNSSVDFWLYRDPQAKIQGPFSSLEMTEWYRAGYFNEDLYVRRVCDLQFRALGELIKICNGQIPFTNTHLIPTGINHGSDLLPFSTENEPSINSLKEYAQNNLMTNIDSVNTNSNFLKCDIQQKLNIQFQDLPERFVQNQEADMNAFFVNDCFDNLTDLEREWKIKQKIKLMLPEYINHLTNLSSMVTLNNSTDIHLHTNVTELSKYHKNFPVDEITNSKHCELHNTELIDKSNSQAAHHNEEHMGKFQEFEKLSQKKDDSFSAMKNWENRKPSIITNHTNEYDKHASSTTKHKNHLNSQTNNLDMVLQKIEMEAQSVEEVVEISKLSESLWSVNTIENVNSYNNGKQDKYDKIKCTQENNIVNENFTEVEETNVIKHNIPSPIPLNESVTKHEKTDTSTQNVSKIKQKEIVSCVSGNSNEKKGYLKEFRSMIHINDEDNLAGGCKSTSGDKLSISKPNMKDSALFNKKFEECYQELTDKERSQKEVFKYHQMKDDKLFLRNDEIRDIQKAAKPHQKPILNSEEFTNLGFGNQNIKGAHVVKDSHQQQSRQSLKTPWSLPVNTKTQNPSFIDIQKAERRERRIDQRRQAQAHQKQRITSSDDSQMVLKWHYPHVTTKNFLDIQDEKIINSKQNQEKRRRQYISQHHECPTSLEKICLSSALISCNSDTANIWDSKKFWNSSNNGFWDDTVRCKSNETSTATILSQSIEQKTINKNEKKNVETCVTSISSKRMKNTKVQKAIHDTKQRKTKKSAEKNAVFKVSSKVFKNNDFEAELVNWCTNSLNNLNNTLDVPTFVMFLCDLESPFEVKDYVRLYLGESKEYMDFAKQFLERRSKYKSLQRAQSAHNDDLCKPAQAITPSTNDNGEHKNKQKKLKKNKMTKLDTRILGFSVTAAEDRINVGDRDYIHEL